MSQRRKKKEEEESPDNNEFIQILDFKYLKITNISQICY